MVLPTATGGCDRFGWLPDPAGERPPTEDLAEAAILRARGRRVVRLHRGVLEPETWPAVAEVLGRLPGDAAPARVVSGLRAAMPGLLPDDLGHAPLLTAYDSQGATLTAGVLLVGPPPRRASTDVRLDLVDEDDQALLAVGEVHLDRHLAGARRFTADAASRVGLRASLAADLALAGGTHDVGKAEVRFQGILRGGDLLAALAEPRLAKSLVPLRDPALLRVARERLGLPPGARHECWSVAMLEGSSLLRTASDPDLVLWLVGTHHGRGRPWHEPVLDPRPPFPEISLSVRVDGAEVNLRGAVDHGLHGVASGWADRFDRLIARYGWWGLAFLEAMLRLADARRSRTEQASTETRDHESVLP